MDKTQKPVAGAPMPAVTVPKVGGGTVTTGTSAGWQLVVVYRGKHCPICRSYLKDLDVRLGEFQALGVEVMAMSADTQEKAEAEAAEEGWRFPVGYGLSVEQMRQLGLYVSEPRSPQETDRPFAEPGLFVVNPGRAIQVVDIANFAGARPALPTLLMGLKFTMQNNVQPRGTM